MASTICRPAGWTIFLLALCLPASTHPLGNIAGKPFRVLLIIAESMEGSNEHAHLGRW